MRPWMDGPPMRPLFGDRPPRGMGPRRRDGPRTSRWGREDSRNEEDGGDGGNEAPAEEANDSMPG